MSERVLRTVIPLLAVFSHIGAFFQFRLQITAGALLAHWGAQFYFLLFCSVVLSLLLLLKPKPALIWTVLILQGFILLLVVLPTGRYLGIEFTMLITVIIEAIIFTRLREGLAFSFILMFFVIFFQNRMSVWNMALPAASLWDLLSMVISAMITVTLTILLRFQNNVSFRELNHRMNEATANLAEINLQLQEYAAAAEQQAVINERKRFGSEIHDTLGYLLTNLVMMLEAAIVITPAKARKLRDHLRLTRDQAKEGLFEMRRSLEKLRPIQSQVSGLLAISSLVNTLTRATHIKVDINFGDAPLNFGEKADHAVYRLVQEGITNALRHGKATRIEISFGCKENGVNVWIKDNGIGTSEFEEGMGLTGMRERLEKLGGNLKLSSTVGEGFLLIAWLPMENSGGEHGEDSHG